MPAASSRRPRSVRSSAISQMSLPPDSDSAEVIRAFWLSVRDHGRRDDMIHRMDSSVVRRRAGPSLAVLGMYIAISFAYSGWCVLPLPARELVGKWQQNDADIFLWLFAWWPHATLHDANPSFTRVV